MASTQHFFSVGLGPVHDNLLELCEVDGLVIHQVGDEDHLLCLLLSHSKRGDQIARVHHVVIQRLWCIRTQGVRSLARPPPTNVPA